MVNIWTRIDQKKNFIYPNRTGPEKKARNPNRVRKNRPDPALQHAFFESKNLSVIPIFQCESQSLKTSDVSCELENSQYPHDTENLSNSLHFIMISFGIIRNVTEIRSKYKIYLCIFNEIMQTLDYYIHTLLWVICHIIYVFLKAGVSKLYTMVGYLFYIYPVVG